MDFWTKDAYPVVPYNPALVLTPLMLGETWREALSLEFYKNYFIGLNKFLMKERTLGSGSVVSPGPDKVYPPHDEVFAWSHHCRIQDVKVVILGQDPYPTRGHAHGLSFSVRKGIHLLPQSLTNIFNELTRDLGVEFSPSEHGDLTKWAKQGVLLLNTVLTYKKGTRYSKNGDPTSFNTHMGKGWETFTDAVIKYIADNGSGVVFMLWGGEAQDKANILIKEPYYLLNPKVGPKISDLIHPGEIPTEPRNVTDSQGRLISKRPHYIFLASHPGQQSAYLSFNGCGHFSAANQVLAEQGKDMINWKDL